MKKCCLLIIILVLVSVISGCTSTKQTKRDITQIKNDMVAMQSNLSRQNLLIQQNQADIESLMDRDEELGVSVAQVKKQQTFAVKASPRQAGSVGTTSVKTAIISDKLRPQPSIRDVQMALRNAGFYRGEVDGKIGQLTRSAIKNFQKANDLKTDGVVGRNTWVKLKDYL